MNETGMNSMFADRISDVSRSFIREILKVALEPDMISFAGGSALLIEDDPYGDLRFSGTDQPSFHQLVESRTLLLGFFAKIIVPGFRLGWVVVPARITGKLVIATHYFCRTCGIYTHHQRRSNPSEFGFNIACLEGVDPCAVDVAVSDGASMLLE